MRTGTVPAGLTSRKYSMPCRSSDWSVTEIKWWLPLSLEGRLWSIDWLVDYLIDWLLWSPSPHWWEGCGGWTWLSAQSHQGRLAPVICLMKYNSEKYLRNTVRPRHAVAYIKLTSTATTCLSLNVSDDLLTAGWEHVVMELKFLLVWQQHLWFHTAVWNVPRGLKYILTIFRNIITQKFRHIYIFL